MANTHNVLDGFIKILKDKGWLIVDFSSKKGIDLKVNQGWGVYAGNYVRQSTQAFRQLIIKLKRIGIVDIKQVRIDGKLYHRVIVRPKTGNNAQTKMSFIEKVKNINPQAELWTSQQINSRYHKEKKRLVAP